MRGVRFIWILCSLLKFNSLLADNDSLSSLRYGVVVISDLSYTGVSTSLAGTFSTKHFTGIVGLKKNINSSYIPTGSPWGLIANLMFFPLNNSKKINGFINLDYQVLFLDPNCPSGECNVKFNFIHEYSLGYGLRYRIGKRFSIISNINVGRYSEHYYSFFQNKRIVFKGYDSIIRLGGNYEF